MSAKLIGKISAYQAKSNLAIIDMTEDEILTLGDSVEIGNGYTQKVNYLEINHKSVDEARRGDVVGLKVDKAVSEGDEVYKL